MIISWPVSLADPTEYFFQLFLNIIYTTYCITYLHNRLVSNPMIKLYRINIFPFRILETPFPNIQLYQLWRPWLRTVCGPMVNYTVLAGFFMRKNGPNVAGPGEKDDINGYSEQIQLTNMRALGALGAPRQSQGAPLASTWSCNVCAILCHWESLFNWSATNIESVSGVI